MRRCQPASCRPVREPAASRSLTYCGRGMLPMTVVGNNGRGERIAGTSLRLLQQLDRIELPAQDLRARALEPAAEQGGVALPEGDLELEVAVVETGQAGMLTHRPALDARAGHEQARGGPMV